MRFAAVLPFLLLAACNGSKVTETLGLGRHAAPDEFDVVSRPPLSVPKEFYLRPPEDGAVPPLGGRNAPNTARRMVTGLDAGDDQTLEQKEDGLADSAAPVVAAGDLTSAGEENFAKRAGATNADPKVRNELALDNAAPVETEEPSWLDRLRGKTNEQPTVDAAGEAARLKANKAAGKPATAGETVTDDPANKSTLERLFD